MADATTTTGLLRLKLALGLHDVRLLVAAAALAKPLNRLYVVLHDGDWERLSIEAVQRRLAFVYQQVARLNTALDVRVVLPCADFEIAPGAPEIDCLLGTGEDESLLESINARRKVLGLSSLAFVTLELPHAAPADAAARLATVHNDCSDASAAKVFPHVCVGGTFDFMHVGHKLLLSLSAHSTSQRLVCGVSDAPLLKKKTLRELMQPIGLRIALVDDFLRSIKPSLSYELSALQDGYGPAIIDAELEAIVVSAETAKGGAMCNVKRAEKAMRNLAIIVMPLVDEGGEAEGGADGGGAAAPIGEETKVSSTHKRRAQLGVLRGADGEAHWCRRSPPGAPYVIGLTGGIASGKSTCRRLLMEAAAGKRKQDGDSGVRVVEVDCDQLAHESYLPGTPTFAALVDAFGEGIVSQAAGSEKTIDRKALGALVFADAEAMRRLCDITWPATAALAQERIRQSSADAGDADAVVVVMEAAVLLEASWDAFCDEVWVVSAPHSVIVERLAQRNGLSAEQAESRIASQIALDERIARSHVLLSSAFGEEAIKEQLARALSGACRRLACTLDRCGRSCPAGIFHALCEGKEGSRGGVPLGLQHRWWGILRDAYCGGNGRPHHSMDRLGRQLSLCVDLARRSRLSVELSRWVAFALIFSGTVRDACASAADNARCSAALWRTFVEAAGSGLPGIDVPVGTGTGRQQAIDFVASCIEQSTKPGEGPPREGSAATVASIAARDLFVDCSWSYLGEAESTYAASVRALRLECTHENASAFAERRATWLREISASNALYRSEVAVAELEPAARRNIEAELKRLMR